MINVLGMKTSVFDSVEIAAGTILALRNETRGRYVCVSNVHMCIETRDSPAFARVLDEADIVVADGRPIFWMQRLLGAKNAAHVRGEDLTMELLEQAQARQMRVGVYGGLPHNLACFVEKIKRDFPSLDIAYVYSPPFRALTDDEREATIRELHQKKVDLLFVALGCPKQELWMHAHRDSLACVMVGVGAAIDFIGGVKPKAPKALQYFGLEWLFRLLSEPKRLWRRYLMLNPRFLCLAVYQILFKRNAI